MQWRIGDGTKTNIWTDKWIPDCPYMIQKPANCTLTQVHELLDATSRLWKQDLIRATFVPAVADKILCIPLSQRVKPDKLCWHPEKKGHYYVKSAYWIARSSVMGETLASTSTGDPYLRLWRKLWNACVPGKVHITLWRACSYLLPTKDRILSKGFNGDLGCLLCPHHFEDTAHTLLLCPIASTSSLLNHSN